MRSSRVTSSGGFLAAGMTSQLSLAYIKQRPRPRPTTSGVPSTPHPLFEAGLLEVEGVGGTGRLSEEDGGVGPAGRGGRRGGRVRGRGGGSTVGKDEV